MSNRLKKQFARQQEQKKKMRIKAIVATAAMAVIIAIVFVFANNWIKNKESLPPVIAGNITETEVKDISKVQIDNGEIVYTLHNSVGFEVEGFESSILDNTSLAGAVLLSVNEIPYTEKIEKIKKLADYGLDNPEKSVTVFYNDGKSFWLLIGDKCSDYEYYAMEEKGNAVYKIPADICETLMKHPSEYCDKMVCTINDMAIDTVTIDKHGEREVTIIRDKNFVPENDYQTSSFLVTYPYRNVTASTSALGYIFENTEEIIAESVVEENPKELSKYGLSADKATVLKITDDTGTTEIKMGDKKDGNVYLMCNDSNVVYLVKSTLYDLVAGYTAKDYVDNFIGIYNIKNVDSIVITKGDKTHTMEIAGNGEDTSDFKIDGKIIGDDTFRKTYQNVIGIVLENIVAETPGGELYMTVTYNFRDVSPAVYEYYSYDDKYCIVKAKNGLSCLVTKEKLDSMLESVTKEK